MGYWVSFGIFIILPILFGIVVAVIVGTVGKKALKPDKLVRLIFPYIKRSGNDTVVFGYILQENHVEKLFWFVLFIVSSTTWIFFTNIFIVYSGNNNPYAGSSLKLQCFHENDCFAINFDFAAAMGQAASALAFAWLIMATLTWAKLNWDEIKNDLKTCLMVRNAIKPNCLHVLLLAFAIVAILISCLVFKHYFGYTHFVTLVKNLLICAILLSTLVIFCDKNIKKKPKTLKDYFKEKFTKPSNRKIKRMLTKRMAKLEFQRLLAHAGYNIESDEEMIQAAYNEIIEKYIEPDDQTQPINESTNQCGRCSCVSSFSCSSCLYCYKTETIDEQ